MYDTIAAVRHLRYNILDPLWNRNFSDCNCIKPYTIFQSRVFGKHFKLYFYGSSHLQLIDIFNFEFREHCYYLLLLDDYTNFL